MQNNKMQIITIFNEKGGVGKTTLTGLIGAGLALKGHKVLLIDSDGQGDLTTNMYLPKAAGFFRFVKWGNPESPDYIRVQDTIQKVPYDACPENLYIVPGNNDSWGIPNSAALPQIVGNLNERISKLDGIFDYTLIDTQPSATTMHDAIGLVTDWFICPTDAEPLSAYGGLRYTIEHINYIREQSLARGRDKAKLMAIVPNKFRRTTSLHQHVHEKLIELYGNKVWEPLPMRTAIPEAQYRQTTLMLDAPDLETNTHIWSLIDNVVSILESR